eukprot:6988562-Prymnesium_polylepis.1
MLRVTVVKCRVRRGCAAWPECERRVSEDARPASARAYKRAGGELSHSGARSRAAAPPPVQDHWRDGRAGERSCRGVPTSCGHVNTHKWEASTHKLPRLETPHFRAIRVWQEHSISRRSAARIAARRWVASARCRCCSG